MDNSLDNQLSTGAVPVLLAHHSEPIDPTLAHWILDQINVILGFGPGVVVLGLGLIVVTIPIVLLLIFLLYRPGRL